MYLFTFEHDLPVAHRQAFGCVPAMGGGREAASCSEDLGPVWLSPPPIPHNSPRRQLPKGLRPSQAAMTTRVALQPPLLAQVSSEGQQGSQWLRMTPHRKNS